MQLSSKTQTKGPNSATRHNILMHRKYIINIIYILSNIAHSEESEILSSWALVKDPGKRGIQKLSMLLS